MLAVGLEPALPAPAEKLGQVERVRQYLRYMGSALRGDFGISFTQQNRYVNDIIREHFPVSAKLGVLSLLFATAGGILFGSITESMIAANLSVDLLYGWVDPRIRLGKTEEGR